MSSATEGPFLRSVESTDRCGTQRAADGRAFHRAGRICARVSRLASAACSCSPSQRSASIAAMQPEPAAVIAWRNTWSCTSPAANTPSTEVRVESARGDDVAVLVEVELAAEQRRCSGRDRWRRTGRSTSRSDSAPVDRVAQAQRLDRAVADHVADLGVPLELDLGVGERAVLHDLRRPQLVAAVDDRDLGRELGEEDRLLDRGVAAADHRDRLLAEEEAVARGAGGHAVARAGAARWAGRACGPSRRW